MLPVSSDFIEFVQRALLPGEDVFGGFGPSEGFGPGVVLQQVVVDGGLQVTDAGVTAPTDAF